MKDNYKKLKITLYTNLDKNNKIGDNYIYINDISHTNRNIHEVEINDSYDQNIIYVKYEAQIVRNEEQLLKGIHDVNLEHIKNLKNDNNDLNDIKSNLENLIIEKEKKFYNQEINRSSIKNSFMNSKRFSRNIDFKQKNSINYIKTSDPIYLNFKQPLEQNQDNNLFYDILLYLMICIFFLSLFVSFIKTSFVSILISLYYILWYYSREILVMGFSLYSFIAFLIFEIILDFYWIFREGNHLWNSDFIDDSNLYFLRNLVIILHYILMFMELFAICFCFIIIITKPKY